MSDLKLEFDDSSPAAYMSGPRDPETLIPTLVWVRGKRGTKALRAGYAVAIPGFEQYDLVLVNSAVLPRGTERSTLSSKWLVVHRVTGGRVGTESHTSPTLAVNHTIEVLRKRADSVFAPENIIRKSAELHTTIITPLHL